MPSSVRPRAVAALAVIAALAFAAMKLVPAGGATATTGDAGRAAAQPAGPALRREADAPALVHVAGAVRRPGVYRLGPDARVRDAVRRAGGAAAAADLDGVNLAARLSDGEQVVVPARGAGAPGPATAGRAGPVSLGSASAEELDSLDGIGPVTAQKIVEWRSRSGGVGSVDELDQVPGIGPKTIESLRGQLSP